jgi:hypothetical protein
VFCRVEHHRATQLGLIVTLATWCHVTYDMARHKIFIVRVNSPQGRQVFVYIFWYFSIFSYFFGQNVWPLDEGGERTVIYQFRS